MATMTGVKTDEWFQVFAGTLFALNGVVLLSMKRTRATSKPRSLFLVCAGIGVAVSGLDEALGWVGPGAAAVFILIVFVCVAGVAFTLRSLAK